MLFRNKLFPNTTYANVLARKHGKWKHVIKELVQKYPSFNKYKIKGNMSDPHASLIITIMNRAKYHCNQLAGSSVVQEQVVTDVPLLPPAKRQRTAGSETPVANYKIPDGETEESLIQKENELREMSKLSDTEYDHEKISNYMEALHNKIYFIVRVSKKTFDELFELYPFLIKLVWCRQYVLLSEKVDAEECFKKFINDRLEPAIRFLSRKFSSVDICIKIEEEITKAQRMTTSQTPRIVGGLRMIAAHLEKSKYKITFKIMDVSTFIFT
jgi:hypothetical protein